MSRHILLVNPTREMARFPVIRKPAEPVELIYLAGALASAQWEVDILDCSLGYGDREDIRRRIALHDFAAVGIAVPERWFLWDALRLAHDVRNLNQATHLFAFGVLAALNARRLLDTAPFFDFVVTGDAESFAQDYEPKATGKNIRLPGLASIEHRETVNGPGAAKARTSASTKQRPTRRPKPSFADRRLAPSVIDGGGIPSVTTSRGCHGSCSFCLISGHYASDWQPRPIAFVRDEVKALVERFDVRRFHFSDSSLLGPASHAHQRLVQLCEVLSEFQPRLRLKTSCRLPELDEARVVMLQQAGFDTLRIGIETFCEDSQTAYGKIIDRDAAVRKLDFVRARGISALIGFIMFDPYLSAADLRTNLEFLLRYPDCWGRQLLLTELIAYPGTRIEQQLAQDGLAVSRSLDGTIWRFRDRQVERIHRRFAALVRARILDLEFEFHACLQAEAAVSSQALPAAECERLLTRCWIELLRRALDEKHPLGEFTSCRRLVKRYITDHARKESGGS